MSIEVERNQKWEAECHTVQLPSFTDARGGLSFIEFERHIPFPIRRIYYLYQVPKGESRGAHAHRELRQLMVALNGSFEVVLTNGSSEKKVTLDRPDCGLFIPPMTWRDLRNFSEHAVCLVLASLDFSEDDYVRDYDEFLRLLRPPHC